tara:strand:+ start:54 stop:200 length:147 start_codon:yes stop_codon:yes gene_type:complete
MNIDDVYAKILDILPNAQMGEDIDDQVVIYTDMMVDDNGELIKYEPSE